MTESGELYTGTCDLCGKEADAALEDCLNIVCTTGCHRPEGDIYHLGCVKKYIGTSSRGTTGKCPKIPYSNFGCPKGKSGKTSAEEPCKGVALHCKRIIVNKVKPSPVAPQVLVANASTAGKKPKEKGAAKAGGTAADEQKRPKQRAPFRVPSPAVPNRPVARLPPIHQAPKPDPLGRNLNRDKPQELPPGFCFEEPRANAQGPGGGKSAKKNQKRAAKRRDDTDTTTAGSATPSGWGDDGSESGWPAGSAAEQETGSIMGTNKFITDVNVFNAMLARQLGSDSEGDSDVLELSEDSEVEQAPPGWRPGPPPDLPDDEVDGWQAVGVAKKGKASAAPSGIAGSCAAAATAAARGRAGQQAGSSATEFDEDAQLRAALEASAAAAGAGAATAGDDDFEQQLARALAESKRAEEEKQRREREAQAALLAAFELQQRQQQPHHKQQQQPHREEWQQPASTTAIPLLSYSQAPQPAATAVTWPAATAAAAAPAAQPPSSLPGMQQQPLQYYQQQPAAVSAAVAPAPAAVPPYQQPPAAPSAAVHPQQLQQQQQPLHFLQQQQQPLPFLQQQQQQAPHAALQQRLPWLQQGASVGAAGPQPGTYGNGVAGLGAQVPAATPSAAAADGGAGEDDDDLGELLALLTTA